MCTDPVLLVDTDIVSMMGRIKPPAGLRPWLLRIGIKRLAISYPVLTELLRGAHLREADDPEWARAILSWVDEIREMDFHYPAMNPTVATIYGRMTSVPALKHMWTVQARQKKNRLGHDLSIAAVAIAHRMPVLTANHDDFLKIHQHFVLPGGIFNPFKNRWFVKPGFEVPLPEFDATEPDAAGDAVILPRLTRTPLSTPPAPSV